MNPCSIPIRLTLAEFCAIALMEAADTVEAADDAAAFISALDGNEAPWLNLREIGTRDKWAVPSPRDGDRAIKCSSRLGRAVTAADIAALITINRRVAEDLVDDGDLSRIRARARLGYREGGGGDFLSWLMAQINKKAFLHLVIPPAPRRREGRHAAAR